MHVVPESLTVVTIFAAIDSAFGGPLIYEMVIYLKYIPHDILLCDGHPKGIEAIPLESTAPVTSWVKGEANRSVVINPERHTDACVATFKEYPYTFVAR